MNWTAITLHNQELDTIIDAAIPNKAQNVAVKTQVRSAINTLMNRIASGWLESQTEAKPTPTEGIESGPVGTAA